MESKKHHSRRFISVPGGLPVGFEPNGAYGESLPEMAGPSAIPDIVDFDGVVCFGISGDGAPFCFDYRGSGAEPRIIWWDDVYWRPRNFPGR